ATAIFFKSTSILSAILSAVEAITSGSDAGSVGAGCRVSAWLLRSGPLLVRGECRLVRRIEASGRRSLRHSHLNERLQVLLPPGVFGHLVHERLWHHDDAVAVADEHVARNDGDTAAADGRLQVGAGQGGDAGGRGGAGAPDR